MSSNGLIRSGVVVVAAVALSDHVLLVTADVARLVVRLEAAASLVVGWRVDDDARTAHLVLRVVGQDAAARVSGVVFAAWRRSWVTSAALQQSFKFKNWQLYQGRGMSTLLPLQLWDHRRLRRST